MVSNNALEILERRYFFKDKDGHIIEDFEKMCKRIAKFVAQRENKDTEFTKEYYFDKYFDVLYNLRFVPNSPTLMNAGRKNGQLSGCFVLGIEDNIESILDIQKYAALIHKSGGGTGFSFSKLRPANSIVGGTNGVSSGPISFMKMYSATTEAIKQGGTRRGSNMGILRVDHPNILEFIDCKQDTTQLNNFNISVAITDVFMEAVKKNKKYDLIDPRTDLPYIDVVTGKIQQLNAREVFEKIVNNAHATGEPGVFFIDTANKAHPDITKTVLGDEKIESTNPCITGDTLIATLNGNIPIRDLVGKEPVLVYTWNPKTKLPELSYLNNTRITDKNAKIIKITFDSGLELKCTYNHNLFTFRGDKVQAKDLKIGQSIRAFSVSSHRDGHIRMHGWVNGKTKHIWVHRFLWELCNNKKVPKGYVVHHINGNPSDNRIDNLELLPEYKHQSIHYPERMKNGFNSIGVNKSIECGKKISESLKKYYTNKTSETIKNHKIIDIQDMGYDAVYNATVENTHTYIIADSCYCGKCENGLMSGIVSANCGEQPLLNFESCNLGSINLGKYYSESKNSIDYDLLNNDIKIATHFLDAIIDLNEFPLDIIKKKTLMTRKIGLGIMGFADLLIKMGIPYGSSESYKIAESISKILRDVSREESVNLGKIYGVPEVSVDRRRNLCTTTIAPTGTIAIIADASHGCEPIFSVGYMRSLADGGKMEVFHPLFVEAMEKRGIKITQKMKDDIFGSLSLKDIEGIPDDVKRIFITSNDLNYEQHVKIQASFQKYVDSGISKTINMPKETPVGDIYKAFMMAYDSSCKGITVYRYGSRQNQVLTKKSDEKETKTRNRKKITYGSTEKIQTLLGKLYITINSNKQGEEPIELFLRLGKTGTTINSFTDAVGRLVSLCLKRKILPKDVAKALVGIKSEDTGFDGGIKYTSIPDLVGKKLSQNGFSEEGDNDDDSQEIAVCPKCDTKLMMTEGCMSCVCGYSKC